MAMSGKSSVFVNLAADDDDEGNTSNNNASRGSTKYPCPPAYDVSVWETLPDDLKKELSAEASRVLQAQLITTTYSNKHI